MCATRPITKTGKGEFLMIGKVRMHIGVRNTQYRRSDGTDEFDPIVSIEMGAITGGDLLQIANGRTERRVRLYDRDAKEFQTDKNLNPLITFYAKDVANTIKADMSKRPDVYKGYSYDVALAALETLAKSLPNLEVVFERYTFARA
jgi:hypothetical protein